MNTTKGNWSGFRNALAGALIALLAVALLSALPAAAGIGDPLLLGQSNHAGNPTTLFNSEVATLRVLNRGTGYPLVLEAEEGRPPLKVNQSAKVKNLNADLLDGRSANAFAASDHRHLTYTKARLTEIYPGKTARAVTVYCDSGDQVTAGGIFLGDYNQDAFPSRPFDEIVLHSGAPVMNREAYRVAFSRSADAGPGSRTISTWVTCLDNPPLHQ